MALLETVTIGLGTAVAKTACGILLGGNQLGTAISGSAIDIAAQKLQGVREQRRLRRFWDNAAEVVADRLEPLLDKEFRDLPDNELAAGVRAVQDTFDQATLTEQDLFAQDLDAGYLDRHLRGQDPDAVRRAGLSEPGSSLYDLLLRQCCAYVIEMVQALPGAGTAALTEILRRERQLIDDLRTVLERLPERRGVADFERDYRQLVTKRLDQVELFGVTLADSSRRYPLSVAYLTLSVSGDFTIQRPGERPLFPMDDPGPSASSPLARVDDVLASTRRLFIRGQAGLGKTTLLQWIAVRSARQDFPERLAAWNDTVPFLVRLRQHASGDLPAPEQFVTEAGRHIAAEMPPGWVQQQLRSGRGVVLVDGVDELTPKRRTAARTWLRELIEAFPHARYVVTSRPAAAEPDWLRGDDFDVAELEPMDRDDVRMFVSRWHNAMRDQCDRAEERERLTDYEQRLLQALQTQRHLRALAGFPLLCALLCALHLDRHGELPRNRMELYDVALQMLLERRDREREIHAGPALSRTELTLLLRDIAYWLIDNGWSSAPADRVRGRIAAKLVGMSQVTAGTDEVYRVLLERTGLIREPTEGQTDFVHRTFQEYLAAQEAVASDNIGALIRNAYTDLWSEVVVLAAGHATASQRTELLSGLLRRASELSRKGSRRLSDSLRLVAVACLETSPELPPDLRREIHEAVRILLPPKNMTAARTIARTGGFALDLLARTEPKSATEVAATIRAASEIGDPAALPLLARFGKDPRKSVVKELLRAWPKFDPEEYARTVLKDCPLDDGGIEISDRKLIPILRHLSNLRRLNLLPEDLEPIDPSFCSDLPELRELTVSDITDLEPLSACQLTTLTQQLCRPLDRPQLSLTPLSRISTLKSLIIYGRKTVDLHVLAELKCLRELILNDLETCDELTELPTLSGLTTLGVGGVADLRSLEPFSFLDQPYSVGAWSCPALEDLSDLRRWTDCLQGLWLLDCPALDLRPISSLRKLTWLNLRGSGPLDVSPVAELPALIEIMMSGDRLPDLHPLRRARALRHLDLGGVSTVDLSPLAGKKGLTVSVDRSTTVHGADELGRGSRVVRV